MRRIVFIVIVAVAVIGFALAGYLYFAGSGPNSGAPSGAVTGGGGTSGNGSGSNADVGTAPLTPLAANAIPPGDTIDFGTPQGIVTVKNFYKAAAGVDGTALVLQRTAGYEITYNADTSGFGIYVFAAPVTANERAAEQSLLSFLGVTQASVCKLSVGWDAASTLGGVPGANYPLSFCL